jgi:hypothetical protein
MSQGPETGNRLYTTGGLTLEQVGWRRKNGKGSLIQAGDHDDLYSQDEALEPIYAVKTTSGL